jgi:hypothetical protein
VIAIYAYSVIRKRALISGYGMLVPLSGLTVVCIMLAYAFLLLPIVEQQAGRVTSHIGKELNTHIKGNTLYAYQIDCVHLLFYVRPRVEFLLNPEQINENVRFLLTRTELRNNLRESGVILDRNPREVFKFKLKKNEYQLVELDGK